MNTLRELIDKHRVSYKYAGEECVEFSVHNDGTVTLSFDDGDEEFGDLDLASDRIEQYASSLKPRDEPHALDHVFEALERAIVDLSENPLDDNLEDWVEQVYECITTTLGDLDLEELGLREAEDLVLEESNGTLWAVRFYDDELAIVEVAEGEQMDW